MDFLIASHNQNKLREFSRILAPIGITVLTDTQAGLSITEVEETGETFEENAMLKAKSACAESGMPCIADDSGLMVDALDGAPGVYSARFSGGHGNDEENIKKLLTMLEGVPTEKRTARFVCTICCVFPDGREFTVKETCEGIIGTEKRGNGGFGYDPVFMVGDKSFAEITPQEKDAISHRGKALRAFFKLISDSFLN